MEAAMDGVEMAPGEDSVNQFCSTVLSKFSNSSNEHDLNVCKVIGAMSQDIKDRNQPHTPVAYFGDSLSALNELSNPSEPPGVSLDPVLTILSLVIDELNPSILKYKYDFFSELLVRVLRFSTIGVNGIVPALKCVSRLLIVREKGGWAEVELLFGTLLRYITDDRPKVRRQSQSCLREVLSNFQISPVLAPLLAPASEAITNLFERAFLFAEGSKERVSEAPRGAQEVLYALEALKFCLPYMSTKSSTNIMKHFKTLLILKQPIVTRRITDCLHALCLHSIGEVSAEVLLDLLCSLITSVTENESSADSMTFTARLLDTGMRRVYSVNKEICVVKLPVVLNALKDILISEHEEATVVAMATFKSLLDACIDEILIKHGIEEIKRNSNVTSRKSGPTVIEKVCATVESLLDYHYVSIWDISFQIVSSMFEKLGKYSSNFLTGTLKTLADMQKLPDGDFPFRKQLHECMGAALGAMGPETFLNVIPLKLEAQDLSEANVWLFPIVKQYTVGANLSFFTKSILTMCGVLKQKSATLEQEGRIYSARSVDGLVYSLWSLLPSFCNYPADTAESFKDLQRALCRALREEHDVRGIICTSLQILIHQNKKAPDGKGDLSNVEISIPEKQAVALYTSQVADANLRVLRSCARELLSVLSGVFLKASKDTRGLLQDAMGELASISEKEVVTRFFRTTMEKLLEVTRGAGKPRISGNSKPMEVDNLSYEGSLSLNRANLFDLAVSLLPGLDAKAIDLLFVAIQPALKDVEGMVQKKAYKVLSMTCKLSDEFISRRLDEMLGLMIEVLPLCHFSAKRHRLDCLYFLIIHVSQDGSEQRRRDIAACFLTEIILALKEANKKTRNRAYDILVEIGHAFGDEEKGGKRENLHLLFNMVAGGLAGGASHMISASTKALARLAYDFSDLVSDVYNVLPSTFLLLQRKNREIIKASLGLLKVLVARSQAEGLQNHLRSLVAGLLNWQDGTKNHFKAKVKQLLEMLVRKCGLDAVKEVMPEEHTKLLTNIRKLKERSERKQVAKTVDSRSVLSKATTSRISRWNDTNIFSDFGGEETENVDADYMDAESLSGQKTKGSWKFESKAPTLRSKRTRNVAKSLQEDLFDQMYDEPLDLLDQKKTKFALRSSELIKKKSDSDDEPEVDAEGRVIIREEGWGKKGSKSHKQEIASDDEADEVRSHLSANSRKAQKRRKTTESGWAYTGSEYASKKAWGDVKRKDKLEPYAYWPLDRKMMSRRPEHRAAARKGMASVVKLTKKLEGRSVSNALAVKGAKLKKGTKKGNKQKT